MTVCWPSYRSLYEALETELRSAAAASAAQHRGLCEQLQAALAARDAAVQDAAQRTHADQRTAAVVAELSALVRVQQDTIAAANAAEQQHAEAMHAATEALGAERARAAAAEERVREVGEALRHRTAQAESMEAIAQGLRDERVLWGKELAAQGAALAADRGALEARVAAMTEQLERVTRERNEFEDSLRVKSKIVDDNVDSIRRLKQTLTERDTEARVAREDTERRMADITERLDAESVLSRQLQHDLERAADRKSELKARLADASTELERLRRENSQVSQ